MSSKIQIIISYFWKQFLFMQNSKVHEKKVLYLARWYPNQSDPMPGLFIRRHALSVLPFYKVSVLSVHLSFVPGASKYETVINTENGLFEVAIYTKASKSGILILDSAVNIYRFFIAHLKGIKLIHSTFGKPDLIHVNVLTRCGLIACLYQLIYGTPYVITEHWTRYLPGMGKFKGITRKFTARVVTRYASAILPVTHNLQLAMEKHGLKNSNYQVIPNVVDCQLFTTLEIVNFQEVKTILHVSCFEDTQKNISGLLRVLKRLSNIRTDWKCTMAGDGIHFDKLVLLAGELGIKDTFVSFTGLRENEDLARLMREATFQVLFSRYENLPVVIPESFASGVPFLSTDVGGINEHITEKLGKLIASEDEPALLEALIYMLDNQEFYNKDYIRNYALEHFSQEIVGKQISEIYDNILSEK